MRRAFELLGWLFFAAFLALCFAPGARAAPVQLLPHTVAGGRCELWRARYKLDSFGWERFESATIRGYRNCEDCAVVKTWEEQHEQKPGETLEIYCVKRGR